MEEKLTDLQMDVPLFLDWDVWPVKDLGKLPEEIFAFFAD